MWNKLEEYEHDECERPVREKYDAVSWITYTHIYAHAQREKGWEGRRERKWEDFYTHTHTPWSGH